MKNIMIVALLLPLNLLAFSVFIVPGHEHLTRYAVESSQKDPAAAEFYGPLKEGAKLRSHPLILGSVLTDMPYIARDGEIDLIGRMFFEEFRVISKSDQKRIRSDIKGHSYYKSQFMHFTRNATDISKDEVFSSYDSCLQSREFITNGVYWATQTLLNEIPEGSNPSTRKYNALSFVGATLHTLQDSFSKAHVKRDKNWKMTSVCTSLDRYFGQLSEYEYKVFCYHTFMDDELNHGGGSIIKDDMVWSRSKPGCSFFDPWNGGFKCLNDEAQKASFVSGKYLSHVLSILTKADNGEATSYENIQLHMNDFFDTVDPDNGKGFLNCDGLANFYPNTLFKL